VIQTTQSNTVFPFALIIRVVQRVLEKEFMFLQSLIQ